MRLTAQEIEQMKSVDIGAVDKETLADASGFTFDPMLPKETRVQRMLEHFKNPYCFRLGDMVISRVDKRLTPQAPHRSVRAPFTHTAPHNNIRF